MVESARELTIELEEGRAVTGLYLRPERARFVFVFAHGAGAGMRHEFMEQMASLLADRGVASLRFQFPYSEAGRKRPDRPGALMATIEAAVARARSLAGELPVLAGGKSMGGRMTSLRQAQRPLDGVRGLGFFGFPLHAAGKPSTARAEHLDPVDVPMLFLQGTRDQLASLDLIRGVCTRLGPRATLHVVEGGDHSFHMLKRSGRTADEVRAELADRLVSWAEGL